MSDNDFFMEDLEFEINFYSYIAKSSNYEIIPIPDSEGAIPTDEEYKFISEECKKRHIKVLYRISNGKYALIFGADLDKIAIVPEDNPHGFNC